MKKGCKRHKWRVGSGVGEFIRGSIVKTKLNIWCERCDNSLKASYFSDYELMKMRSKKNKEEKK